MIRNSLLTIAWCVFLILGLAAQWNYMSTAGQCTFPQTMFPTDSTLPRSDVRPTLLIFVHPKCPCTEATIATIWETMEFAQVPVDAWIVGVEARRFGAKTSGETMLFGAQGHLLFHGGVTGGRGTAGPNPGLEHLRRFLNRTAKAELESTTRAESAPVFGCPLFSTDPDAIEHPICSKSPSKAERSAQGSRRP